MKEVWSELVVVQTKAAEAKAEKQLLCVYKAEGFGGDDEEPHGWRVMQMEYELTILLTITLFIFSLISTET